VLKAFCECHLVAFVGWLREDPMAYSSRGISALAERASTVPPADLLFFALTLKICTPFSSGIQTSYSPWE